MRSNTCPLCLAVSGQSYEWITDEMVERGRDALVLKVAAQAMKGMADWGELSRAVLEAALAR